MEKETIIKLYDTTKERNMSSEYDNLRRYYSEESEKFLKKIGEENRAELEHLTNILHEMDDILSREDFCNGFSMAVRLFVESTYKEEGD